MDENGGIGLAGRLPWHISSDLRRFRRITMGHHLIMGRKTFQSIRNVLDGRVIIVLTRNRDYESTNATISHSLADALAIAKKGGDDEVFICGGSSIFSQTLQLADRIYLTRVHTQAEADTFFPSFDESLWFEREASYHEASDKDEYAYTFKILEKYP
jgi:dihydrofolate reductase